MRGPDIADDLALLHEILDTSVSDGRGLRHLGPVSATVEIVAVYLRASKVHSPTSTAMQLHPLIAEQCVRPRRNPPAARLNS